MRETVNRDYILNWINLFLFVTENLCVLWGVYAGFWIVKLTNFILQCLCLAAVQDKDDAWPTFIFPEGISISFSVTCNKMPVNFLTVITGLCLCSTSAFLSLLLPVSVMTYLKSTLLCQWYRLTTWLLCNYLWTVTCTTKVKENSTTTMFVVSVSLDIYVHASAQHQQKERTCFRAAIYSGNVRRGILLQTTPCV